MALIVKKKNIIIGFILLVIIGVTACSSPMERMNVDRFNTYKSGSRYYPPIKGVELAWQEEYYYQDTIYYAEYRFYKNKKEGDYTTFYPDGTVHSKGKVFHFREFQPVGIQTFYNEKGKIIRMVDWEKYYPMSFDDVIEWLKKDGWDLTDGNRIGDLIFEISRSGHITFPKYTVNVYWDLKAVNEWMPYRRLLFDATSGDVLSDRLFFLPEINRWTRVE